MNITLCDTILNGDIPTYKFNIKEAAFKFICGWLETKDFKKSVFVCFQSWENLPNVELRDVINSILVSHVWDDIVNMVESYLDVENFKEIDFSIFEFESYQEAFKYCIDLRESF